MKRDYNRRILAALCAFFICCTTAQAIGYNYRTKQLLAEYADIKLVVDGVPVTPTDSNGMPVEPFACEGITYLPIRAVGEALGKQVTWDGKTKTVYIGEAPGQKLYLTKVCPPYKTIAYWENEVFSMDGVKYYVNSFNMGNPWMHYRGSALYNLNGRYSAMKVTVGHTDSYADREDTVFIYLDGELAHTIELPPECLAKTVTIPLGYANQMKIENTDNGAVGFANAELIP